MPGKRFRATIYRQGPNPYVDVPESVSRAFAACGGAGNLEGAACAPGEACRRGRLRALRVARHGGLEWNSPAIKFYKSLGAKVLEEWLTTRLTGDALKKLAEQANPL